MEIRRHDEARPTGPFHQEGSSDAFGWVDAALATCDWRRTAASSPRLRPKSLMESWIVTLFTLLGICDDPALQLQCAKTTARQDPGTARTAAQWQEFAMASFGSPISPLIFMNTQLPI
jgi:hypothetical protein